MSEAVDKLIEANQKASEQHRIAYGQAMYNQAIQDAIRLYLQYFMIYDDVNPSKTKDFIDALEKLKKPSQSPNQ